MSELDAVDPRWCIRDWFPGKLARARIETSESFKATLLRSIRRYSENRKAGEDLAETRYKSSGSFKFDKYQAHTRQAVAFYEAAEGAHHRASPLLYYYSFSNFADALIALTGRDSGTHGIKWRPQGPSLWDSEILLDGDKRFQRFYAIVTSLLEYDLSGYDGSNDTALVDVFSTIMRPTSGNLRVGHLCQYITDINHEVEDSLKQPSRFSTLKLSISKAVDGQGYQGRMAVTLCGPDCTRDPDIDPEISKILRAGGFEKDKSLKDNEEQLLQIFGLTLERARMYSFWKTSEILNTIEEVTNKIAHKLRRHMILMPFQGESILHINLEYPLSSDEHITIKSDDKKIIVRMNDFIGVYLVMFALNSIVRYYATDWERFLAQEDTAYIIEGFVKSAPLTFLRYYRNLLDGECWMVSPR